ncbi:cytochrome P450 705A12-like [Pistacia vera]|uniref:cytochrome P450 705A12-like n=1 Tax=Pistacia vera TaxID=55513 RepID=UPI001263CBAA|nr:cytochrome P450 705A12-like [Pistacia vera]
MATINVGMQCYFIISLFIFIMCTFLLRFLFKRLTSSSSTTHLRLPPSPPALPLIGHLHLMSLTVHKSVTDICTKYGPLLYLRIGYMHCVVVSSAAVALEIFKTHDINFAYRPQSVFRDSIFLGNLGFFAAPYGDSWRFMKKLCVSDLLGARHLERSRNVRREEIMRLLSKILEKAGKNEVVDVGSELGKIASSVLMRMVTGAEFSEENCEADMMKEMVEESLVLLVKFLFAESLGPFKILAYWLLQKRGRELTKWYDELLEKYLEEHEVRANGDGDRSENRDLMDILLEVYHDEKSEFKITKTNIKAFLLDLLVAGISGTDESVKWVIAELINHPDSFNKAREEIESVVGRNRLVEESDIRNLPFLQAVVKETLRIHPHVPIMFRESHRNCNIKGFDIPGKTITVVNVYAIMRDPEFWDKPNEFRPERFLVYSKEEEDSETKKQLFNYCPFGGGRRSCPGALLSSTIMSVAAAAMVQCFDFEVEGSKFKLQAGPGMSLSLPEQLMCRPVVHFNPFAQT